MISIIALPFITGFIGWLTNWVAIKMLFHPRKPKNFLFFKWQGLIPKRQVELADSIADVVEREILGQHIVKEKINSIDLEPFINEFAGKIIQERVAMQLKSIPLIGSFINDQTINMLEEMAKKAMIEELPSIKNHVANKVEEKLQIREIISEKIAQWELDRLEEIVNQVAKKEFATIERMGAVVGFAIGLIQIGLLWLNGSISF